MKLIGAYFAGLKNSWALIRIAALVYSINLFLALCVAMPFLSSLEQQAGNSLALNKMATMFHAPSYFALLSGMSETLASLVGVVKWILPAYLLLSVFFSGGIILFLFLEKKHFTFSQFFEACAGYFLRMFKLFLLTAIQHLWFFLIYLILVFVVAHNFDFVMRTEINFVRFLIVSFKIYLIIAFVIQISSYYSRIWLIVHDRTHPFAAMAQGYTFVFRYFAKSYFLYLMLLVVPILFTLVYWFLSGIVPAVNLWGVGLLLIIQQIFIFAKMLIKMWFYGSQISLYNHYCIATSTVES